METKTLYAVTISQGQYEDNRSWTDSEWSKEEDANKRKVIIENEVKERDIRQERCFNCPLNTKYIDLDNSHLTENQIKECLEYCKKYNKFTPKIENKIDREYKYCECDKNIQYPDDPVTISIETRTNIDNMELLKDGSTVFN